MTEPYDLSQLPAFYQGIVRSARETKERVIRVIEVAERTKIRAQNAAALARQYPRHQAINGCAHFKADNGNDYAGEVDAVGTLLSSNGFGVSEDGSQSHFGDKYYCRFERNKGCQGVGVLEFAENEGNKASFDVWKGNFSDGKWGGLGYLRVNRSSDNPKQFEVWSYVNSEEAHPGVWQLSDGSIFEGTTRIFWHGWGVLWDPDGQVRKLGRWEEGALVEDQTQAWRNGRLER